jgi:hypothetical protein
MRKTFTLVVILITSFVMTLSGLVASSVAMASENETVTSSFSFPTGSSVLTKAHKASLKKVVTTAGEDATFLVTVEAGRLPGVSDKAVQLLAKKRGQVIKAYLVKLGVNKSNVTTKVKITRLGIVPKTKIVGSVAAPTTPIELTCATGGTCAVGDRGPGGGIVFYVSAANFTSTGSTCDTACKYLEVAPATWQDGVTIEIDDTYSWSNNTNDATQQDITTPSTEGIVANSADEKLNWKIGEGFNNTRIMRVEGAVSEAQAAVLAYAGTDASIGQWFIPSTNELNELCKYANGLTPGVLTAECDSIHMLKTGLENDLGGFNGSDYYWSSSERNHEYAWCQFFGGGSQDGSYEKSDSFSVRPVRAF